MKRQIRFYIEFVDRFVVMLVVENHLCTHKQLKIIGRCNSHVHALFALLLYSPAHDNSNWLRYYNNVELTESKEKVLLVQQ